MEILITEPENFSEEALKKLKMLGNVHLGPIQRKELSKKVSQVDVLVIRLSHLIDRALIENAKKLKYIITPTTGLNHIDVDYAEKKNIEIISLKDEQDFLETIPSTAEHTWALLLSLIRKIPQSFEDVKKGNWNRDAYKGNNLNALSIGIFGFGRVGKQVARIAKCFNMQVFVYDKKEIVSKDFEKLGSKEELFQKSDIISIHLDFCEDNKEIVNKELLKHLKRGSYVINTSRGELINEFDLVEFLENKTLEGVAMDVLQNENDSLSLFESPIIKYAKSNKNIIITPHTAGATYQSMRITEEFVVDKLIDRLKHQI